MKRGRCWRSNDQAISVPTGPTCPEQNRRVVSSVCVRPVFLSFCLSIAAPTDSRDFFLYEYYQGLLVLVPRERLAPEFEPSYESK